MNEYRKIQSETLGTYIGYHDTVSGAFSTNLSRSTTHTTADKRN